MRERKRDMRKLNGVAATGLLKAALDSVQLGREREKRIGPTYVGVDPGWRGCCEKVSRHPG